MKNRLRILLAIGCLCLNLVWANEADKSFGYYNLLNPKAGIDIEKSRQKIGIFDRVYGIKSCDFGDGRVCIKSPEVDWLFTVPLREDWQEGEFIKGTDIKMIAIRPFNVESKITELWILERGSLQNHKIVFNYSPHFGLLSFFAINDQDRDAYASNKLVGYGATLPVPTED